MDIGTEVKRVMLLIWCPFIKTVLNACVLPRTTHYAKNRPNAKFNEEELLHLLCCFPATHIRCSCRQGVSGVTGVFYLFVKEKN